MIHSTIGKLIKNGLVVLLLLLSVTQPTIGQVFPVQANISITPPYTVYLSNYTSPQQQRVMVNILLHDPVTTSVDVRFKFSIEGGGIQLYTNPNWMPQPYTLTSGIPILLTSDIIAEYFQPQHLVVEGINPQEFFRNGKMPEGFYRFKVEVLQYQRGVTISNTAQTGVWLLLNEAPRMVFPTPNQKVLATNPQMLNFSWVPGGITSPLSAQTTMYEFTMVEVQNGMDPTIAITTTSDAVKFTRTTQQTSLLYGPSEPQLIPGKQYAIRVRAYNTDGYEIFKNNGYSDVRVFQFGDACNPPVSFTLGDETQSTFSIDVITSPGNSSWIAQFRENSDDVDEDTNPDSWSELKPETGTTDKTVKGLKASTTYQVQVKATCGGYTSDFLPMQTVTTAEKVNANRSCDSSIPIIDIPNALPLQELKAKDVFFASLFPIVVSEVAQQGSGKFSGKGVVTMPLFNTGLAVSFTDVGINEVYQLTSGEVIADRNETGITLFGDDLPSTGGSGSGTGTGGLDSTETWPPFTDTISIDVPFDSVIVVNDSTIWVVPTGGGEPIVVDLGGSTCTLITPSDGNMDNAKVVYNGAAQPYSSGSGSNNSEQEEFTGFLANFSASNEQHYGFDSLRNQVHANYYQEMIVNGKTVKLPWKALAPGKIDPVKLRVKRSADSYPYSDLKVSILGGNDLQPTIGANTANQTYNLTGTTDGDEFAVITKFRDGDKDIYAGGLWAATYSEESFKLFIVPFPKVDVTEGEIGQLQNGLNQIYSQAVVSWDVKPMNGFTGIDLGDNGLDWAESDMLSSYDAEMNSVISAFKDWKENPDPDAYYLFVVPKFSESNLEGFMPRNRRFGFITADQLNARTVAHELGHGAFNLRHTFPEATQGSTDNLMDYTQDKYALLKAQWDLIHNPEATTGLFDDMGDGALKGTTSAEKVTNVIEMIRCAYKTDRKVKFEKDTWKWFTEAVSVTDFNELYDNQTYGYISVELLDDVDAIEIPEKLTYEPDDNYLAEVFRGEVVKFDLGTLIIKVDKNHAHALYNYLKPSDADFESQKKQFIQKIVEKYEQKHYTRAKVIDLLSISSQCLFEYLTQEQRIALLKLINDGSNIPETVERIVIDIIRTTPRDQIDYLLEHLYTDGLMAYYDGAINDIGGKDYYTRFITELANLFYKQHAQELKESFSTTQYGDIYLKQTQKISYIGYYQLPPSTKIIPYYHWKETCDNIPVTYNGKTLDISRLKNCGYLSETPTNINPFEIVVVYFESDKADKYLFLREKFEDRVVAMPAFMLRWIYWQVYKSEAAKDLNTALTIADFVVTLGEGPVVVKTFAKIWRSIKIGKELVNVMLLNDDLKKWLVEKYGDNGVAFIEYWGVIDNVTDYIADPLFKAINMADFMENFINASAAWDAIKIDPELSKYLSDDYLTKTESLFQTLKNYYNDKGVVE